MGALNTQEEREREIEALRASISRPSAAILRISESHDLETFLREALEGARLLTGTHCGAITALDEAGQPEALVASSLTADLLNGGSVENAQAVAVQHSPRTTEFYDRIVDWISLDEIERIAI